jgi:hypothetical protein
MNGYYCIDVPVVIFLGILFVSNIMKKNDLHVLVHNMTTAFSRTSFYRPCSFFLVSLFMINNSFFQLLVLKHILFSVNN